MTQRLRTQAVRAAQRPLSFTRAESVSVAMLRPVHFAPARCDSIRAWRAGLRGGTASGGHQGSVQRSASTRSSGRGSGAVVKSGESRRKGMKKWRQNLKKPREEVLPSSARAPEAPAAPQVYHQPPQQQQAPPQAPSFMGNMLTYLVLGAGMTAGLIFVRLATGLEPAPSDAQLERWPSASASSRQHQREEDQVAPINSTTI